MTTDKAIEILIDLLRDQPTWPPDDRRDAVTLGIEALKRLRSLRTRYFRHADTPLPRETKK